MMQSDQCIHTHIHTYQGLVLTAQELGTESALGTIKWSPIPQLAEQAVSHLCSGPCSGLLELAMPELWNHISRWVL
jgi:hypothetical protein